ncbi:hypothetical protein [Sinomonas atrocyanea]
MDQRNLPDEPERRDGLPVEGDEGRLAEREPGEERPAKSPGPHPGTPVPRHGVDDTAADGRSDVTPSSQGVGAVWGDAERTPNPGPVRPAGPDDQARIDAVAEEYEIATTEEGEHYLTPREDAETASQPARDDFPDH